MSYDLLDYHRRMLTDAVRVEAWQSAVRQIVRPGDVVADVGAGTGLLTLLACAAGARRVYAIESTQILEVARELAERSGLRDKVVFLARNSLDVSLPEPADVVVGDVLGSFGINGSLLPTLNDARRRLLRPGGRIAPCAVELYVAPVELPDWRRTVLDCWDRAAPGFDFGPLRRRLANVLHFATIPPGAILAEPASAGRIDLTASTSDSWSGQARFVIRRPGRLDGVAGWCAAWLTSEISVTNSPFSPRRTEWSQVLLPLEAPVDVSAGDGVAVAVGAAPLGPLTAWSWQVTVSPAGGPDVEIRQSSLPGELISVAEIYRQSRDYRPKLTPYGEAVRQALALIDGSRTALEIREHVAQRFPDLFPNSSRAARLLSNVILVLCE